VSAAAPRLTVVTVVHDSAAELALLLDSLARHLGDAPPQVVVVDSGSADDGAALAGEAGAEVVRLEGNPGFGAANNAGVARATGDVVALLNPDVELLDAGLLRLADRARADGALHVPRLTGHDRRTQDSAHPLPGTRRELLRALAPGPLRAEPWRARRERKVGWAIAAAVVARAETLRALGPFDPAAFLFYEDLDLCLRARQAGIATVLHPGITLRHAGAHATRPAYGGEPVELLVERRRAVIGARLGPRALARDDAAQLLTHGVRAFRARDRAFLRAVARARRGAAG
jgi:N-acetylglucosaminyl-diphospho-decaprenol L-rhamnosyltransferase